MALDLLRLQRLFGTVPLYPRDWLICVGVASTVFVAEELRKLVARRYLESAA